MKLIVGLGNPGPKYADTRHNVGFKVAAALMTMVHAGKPKAKFNGEIGEGSIEGQRVAILAPMTYMNSSGQSVRQAIDFYKMQTADMLVVCDDLNLPLGQLRVRSKGSSGGQKGLADIIRLMGTEEVPRLRIGIDSPPAGWEVADYVLSPFKKSEQDPINQAVEAAAHAALVWVTQGLTVCMNQFNVKQGSK
jgi:PTH1 family peptidyl-tRNA hydrolase